MLSAEFVEAYPLDLTDAQIHRGTYASLYSLGKNVLLTNGVGYYMAFWVGTTVYLNTFGAPDDTISLA
jgi:hypothetical protein